MKDPLGIVPPDIKARYEAAEWVDGAVKSGRALEAHLKATFGPEMEVVLVKTTIDPEKCPESCIPGRWHVRRNNSPPTLPSYIPITTPDGGYRDPDFGVVEELHRIDLTRREVKERVLAQTRTDSPHKAAERALKKEQRRDVMAMDYRAARRTRGEGGLKKSFEGKRRVEKAPSTSKPS